MTKIITSIIINRPIEEVFAFVSDSENDTTWWLGVIESDIVSDIKRGKGVKYKQISIFLGMRNETVCEVIEYVPMHHVTLKTITSAIPFVARSIFESTTNGTRVTMDAEVEYKGFYKIIQPFTNFMLRRVSNKSFKKLKEVMESPNYKAISLQKDISSGN